MYRTVPAQVELPAMEHEVLRLWREERTFERSLEQRADAPLWVFYEGPPTANGMPGTHHVEARAIKDVFPRYRTMKGFRVPRKAGWDCHGLPVEIAVEKDLGFSGKGDIEEFGVAAFNERCRSSVLRHVDAFEQMTERMGYWVDLSQAYWTMDPAYVQSVWWSLKQVWDKGLLVRDHRVAPYCPRCGTGLSDHELAQGYETVVDPSVYVRFPITDGHLATLGAQLLVWTTTPWTLVSNTAVAAHPDVDYVVARTADGELLVLAEPLVDTVLGEGTERVDLLSGAQLAGVQYRAPFALVELGADDRVHRVVTAEYVTVEDGTGLVHIAPAFGLDDLVVGRAHGLPVVNPVDAEGRFDVDLDLVGGDFFKEADAKLVADLESRGLLFRHQPYEHSYPHCWRCHTPLLYYAQPSWYLRTTAVKDALLRENEATTWYPEHVKWGRYGDWLRNNVDWALSRNRFWGTPLPIWVNDEDDEQAVCVGSLAELSELAGTDLTGMDPHRPFVDEVTFTRPGVPGTFRRVPEVIDVWYDSGAMPFAQWGYPHEAGSAERLADQYPAQFISEALDQTRGWFYSLMAVGTLVFDRSSYENVVCLGLILAEDGRRMSKHLGNILEPIPLMDAHGADALRWFMLASGSPWQPRKVGHAALQEIVRKVLLTYWNTASFLSLYGRTAGFQPGRTSAPPTAQRQPMDRWLLSQTQQLVREVDQALADFDSPRAGRAIAQYVDDLSNWYVRRSRRRFWRGDPSALATLHEAMSTLTLVMAPLVPFVTERVWQDLVRSVTDGAPASVHLADWPAVDAAAVDDTLAEQMALVRRLVELGRSARAESGLKTRQPLRRALVAATGWDELPPQLRTELADELNVQEVASLAGTGADLVQVHVKPSFRSLGKRFGTRTPVVAQAIAAAEPVALTTALRDTGSAELVVEGEPVTVGPDDVVVTETPREGWAVSHVDGDSIALDLALTPQLRRLGLVRDVVRLVQEARKASGLEVTDRIRLWWSAVDETAESLREHGGVVADEVLAAELVEGLPNEGSAPAVHVDEDLGLRFSLERFVPTT